jgi:hypothetical protein
MGHFKKIFVENELTDNMAHNSLELATMFNF